MTNEAKLIKNVKTELKNLDKAVVKLQESYQHCKAIGVYDDDVVADALSIRFARASDIFTQKILTSVVILSLEDFDGFIDKVNICEKLNAIISAEDVFGIRRIRNKVNHEYAGQEIIKIFNDTLKYTPKLLANIEQTNSYINQNYKNKDD
ncbi:hypothetical protein SPONN_82 [uncultured Candidatus Thioglobus sp.]|nr:hypothetical protein SPONN_82 [uncultured Candidatus Thioglobus sp.]SMN01290.1 hypothetical protein SPONL_1907 [uncultured Candidatus Thioglobus sp.]